MPIPPKPKPRVYKKRWVTNYKLVEDIFNPPKWKVSPREVRVLEDLTKGLPLAVTAVTRDPRLRAKALTVTV